MTFRHQRVVATCILLLAVLLLTGLTFSDGTDGEFFTSQPQNHARLMLCIIAMFAGLWLIVVADHEQLKKTLLARIDRSITPTREEASPREQVGPSPPSQRARRTSSRRRSGRPPRRQDQNSPADDIDPEVRGYIAGLGDRNWEAPTG